MKVMVRWHPQYCNPKDHSIITNYRVYAYVIHPLSPIIGTEYTTATKTQAQRLATQMRRDFNHE